MVFSVYSHANFARWLSMSCYTINDFCDYNYYTCFLKIIKFFSMQRSFFILPCQFTEMLIHQELYYRLS